MKKIIALVSLFFVFSGLFADAYAVTGDKQIFSDVPESHWANVYILKMAQQGVFNGYADSTFRPENHVTRAELAQMLSKIEGTIHDGYSSGLKDVNETDWFANAISATQQYFDKYRGSVKEGKTTYYYDYFHPNEYAVREDVIYALMKQRYNSYKSVEPGPLCKKFVDLDVISPEKYSNVILAIEEGIISGYYNAQYDVKFVNPQDYVTRAEVAAMLYRLYVNKDTTGLITDKINYNSDCTLDEFIDRYNDNLEKNYTVIEKEDTSNLLGAKKYFIDKSMLIEVKFKKLDEYNNLVREVKDADEKLLSEIEKIGEWTSYATVAGSVVKDSIVCDNDKKVKFLQFSVSDPKDDSLNKPNKRNSYSVAKYKSACALASLYNTSFEDGCTMLEALLYNISYKTEGDFDIEISSYSFNATHKDIVELSGVVKMGIIPPKKADFQGYDCTIEEFIDKYNSIVIENYKHIVDDLRWAKPEDFIINKKSLLSTSKTFETEGISFDINIYVLKGGEISILCNTQNEVICIETNCEDRTYGSYDYVNLDDFSAICMLAAIEDMSFEDATKYCFTALKDKSINSDKSVLEYSYSELQIFSKKFAAALQNTMF